MAAHRKALEAALYENVETPRQRLNRCKHIRSADAEYHEYTVQEEGALVDDFAPTLKCLDDNGFEVSPIATGLAIEDSSAVSLSVDDLFTKVSESGVSMVGASKCTESCTLEFIEATLVRETADECKPVVKIPRSSDMVFGQVYSAASDAAEAALPRVTGNSPRGSTIAFGQLLFPAPRPTKVVIAEEGTNKLESLMSISPGLSATSSHSPVSSTLDPEARPFTPPTPYSKSGGADPFKKVLDKASPCFPGSATTYVIAPPVAEEAGLHGHGSPWDTVLDKASSCSYVYGR
jgi:hypothetical protein